MSYRVRLNVFEGPFDLLVYLIEHAQMSIYDIRISEITDQYVQYIRQMQEADINVSTEFMVLAAELLEIKSKLLLPRSAPDADAEGFRDAGGPLGTDRGPAGEAAGRPGPVYWRAG